MVRDPERPVVGDLPSAYGDHVYGFYEGHSHHGRLVRYDVPAPAPGTQHPARPDRAALTHRRVTATPSGPVVTGVDSTYLRERNQPAMILADL